MDLFKNLGKKVEYLCPCCKQWSKADTQIQQSPLGAIFGVKEVGYCRNCGGSFDAKRVQHRFV